MQGHLERIVAEVKMPPPPDLERLEQVVAGLRERAATNVGPEETEGEFERRLAAGGFLRQAPPPVTDFAVYDNYQFVIITGRPVSEMIVKERR
jgi:hypothetical protein